MSTQIQPINDAIENFLLLLTQKEKFVIERRFNLDNQERSTLEEIGNKYSVTRERIRQIEKNALSKLRRNIDNATLFEVSEMAFAFLSECGGVCREDFMISHLIGKTNSYSKEALQLILSVDKRFKRVPNTVNFYPFLIFNELNETQIAFATKQAVSVLKKNMEVMSAVAIFKACNQSRFSNIDLVCFTSMLKTDKKIKCLSDQKIGLVEWRHINPRTLRDKIYFILRANKEPMHFVEISNNIISHKFDKKKINLQAVHNELIRHSDFILIGRGIYGLKEWGYEPGTVAQIIEKLLSGKESLSQQEIIESVLRQRKVKPITIVLSLKNKKQFVRVGRKQYSLLKS